MTNGQLYELLGALHIDEDGRERESYNDPAFLWLAEATLGPYTYNVIATSEEDAQQAVIKALRKAVATFGGTLKGSTDQDIIRHYGIEAWPIEVGPNPNGSPAKAATR